MKKKKRSDKSQEMMKGSYSKFTAPPVVANAIANSYGHIGGWESFLTPVKDDH